MKLLRSTRRLLPLLVLPLLLISCEDDPAGPGDGTYYFSVCGFADSDCGHHSISVVVQ